MDSGEGATRPGRRTIYDVAERASVSLATVSRFMNGSGYVGARARARIEAAVRELEYVPSQPARALGGRRSQPKRSWKLSPRQYKRVAPVRSTAAESAVKVAWES